MTYVKPGAIRRRIRMEANARLIANAPELLVALTLLRGKMKSGWMDREDISRTLGVVDQAIAHAAGQP